MTVLPWVQVMIEQTGWRTACTAVGLVVLVVLVPINLLLRKRPQDMGLLPDGDQALTSSAKHVSNVVDPVWASIDWTLARAIRTARFWWLALGLFGGLYAWYAVQVHQTKYLLDIGFTPGVAAWALGMVSLFGVPGQIFLGHLSDRIGREWIWTVSGVGFAICFASLIALESVPTSGARLCHGDLAGPAGLWRDVHHGRRGFRDFPGRAFWQHFRHAHAGRAGRRRRRSLVTGVLHDHFGTYIACICPWNRSQLPRDLRGLDGVAGQGKGGGRTFAPRPWRRKTAGAGCFDLIEAGRFAASGWRGMADLAMYCVLVTSPQLVL